jgi:hypothetical protein
MYRSLGAIQIKNNYARLRFVSIETNRITSSGELHSLALYDLIYLTVSGIKIGESEHRPACFMFERRENVAGSVEYYALQTGHSLVRRVPGTLALYSSGFQRE